MRRLFRWFFGYVQVGLSGRQVNRFLNLCSRNGISLWNVKHDLKHNIRVLFRLRDFYYLKPFLRKTKTKMWITARRGFPFWCHRHPRLKWFPVFVLAVIGLTIYSSTFIWDIRIEGNERISDRQLLQLLEEHEIEVGQKSSLVDCAQLEYDIREAFSDIGWVSVYMKQTNLFIEVRESLYDEHEDYTADGKRYDLIANKDAYIYSMVTRTGTAVVQQGMSVEKGETLVEGRCEILDDAGLVKDVLQLKAEAEILGNVTYFYMEPLTEIEIMAMKIADTYSDKRLYYTGIIKMNRFLENLEENGVIILDKSVMIDKNEKSIAFRGNILTREEIGINIRVEEVTEYELE